ncbi:MAG: 2,3-bisphosphoglycerate-independent phosphoglycerate mutase [Bacillota bacterium]
MPRPLVLVVLDGWGMSDRQQGNAVSQARTPNMDRLVSGFPHSQLEAYGEAVGLLPGQMGNSNVGHLNLGAGRIVYQDLARINKAIDSGAFFRNPVILSVMRGSGAFHVMGLVSDGGVHSHLSHLEAILRMAKAQGLPDVYIHAFLDGRDVGPKTALGYLEHLERLTQDLGAGRVATVCGRYFAMDRDNRWTRVRKAYEAMVLGHGPTAPSSLEAVKLAYTRGETDEFVTPTVVVSGGMPVGRIGPGDSMFFFNFRADRARQITRCFTQETFDEFPRPVMPSSFAGMIRYNENSPVPAAFESVVLGDTLGEILSMHGLTQLRVAETEKYAHVTFFLNGGREEPFPGEDRVLVPSPQVATYDTLPSMSAYEVTRRALDLLGQYDVIIMNYANPDMVGHTGVLDAAIKAIEVVDECLGNVADGALAIGGVTLIVADHGNAEQMLEENGKGVHTAHTPNKVPFVLVDPSRRDAAVRDGILADVAPTILEILGLPQPQAMEGRSLLLPSR